MPSPAELVEFLPADHEKWNELSSEAKITISLLFLSICFSFGLGFIPDDETLFDDYPTIQPQPTPTVPKVPSPHEYELDVV